MGIRKSQRTKTILCISKWATLTAKRHGDGHVLHALKMFPHSSIHPKTSSIKYVNLPVVHERGRLVVCAMSYLVSKSQLMMDADSWVLEEDSQVCSSVLSGSETKIGSLRSQKMNSARLEKGLESDGWPKSKRNQCCSWDACVQIKELRVIASKELKFKEELILWSFTSVSLCRVPRYRQMLQERVFYNNILTRLCSAM